MTAPKIDVASESWQSVCAEIEGALQLLRKGREAQGKELRELDFALGSIKALESLLHLPERQSKKPPEPIRGSGVRVPGMRHTIGEIDG